MFALMYEFLKNCKKINLQNTKNSLTNFEVIDLRSLFHFEISKTGSGFESALSPKIVKIKSNF